MEFFVVTNLRELMARKSCAVGMSSAILRNHLKRYLRTVVENNIWGFALYLGFTILY